MGLDHGYLDSRASIDYSSHDEIQMRIIVDKIKDELIKRYGLKTNLIKDNILRNIVENAIVKNE